MEAHGPFTDYRPTHGGSQSSDRQAARFSREGSGAQTDGDALPTEPFSHVSAPSAIARGLRNGLRSALRSDQLLFLCGLILLGIGLYFAFARPALLPEDVRYLRLHGAALAIADLPLWLHHVFTVMGGFIFSSGLLLMYLARTSFARRQRGAALVAALAGVTSVGVMTAVNFLLVSDFRFLLLTFACLWGFALALYALGK